MIDLTIYSIKSAMVAILLFVPYMIMLQNDSLFRTNRLVLILILILSLWLPLLNVSWFPFDKQNIAIAAPQQLMQFMQPSNLHTAGLPAEEPSGGAWGKTVFIIYLVGLFAMMSIRLVQLLRMKVVTRSGCLWTKDDGNIRIFCHADNVAPFSWMNHIVINEADFKQHAHEIILHEKGHILHHHSLDILLLTIAVR